MTPPQTPQTWTAVDLRSSAATRRRSAKSKPWATGYADTASQLEQGADAIDALAAAAEREAGLREENQELHQQLGDGEECLLHLLTTIAPQCQPLPTLSGIVSQIDNYIAGQQAALAAKDAEIARLTVERDKARDAHASLCPYNTALAAEREAALRAELANIANADWRGFDVEVRSADDFVAWAKSRARYALGLAPAPTTGETPR